MDDLLSEFLTETAESLDVVDVELVKLEQEPNNEEILANIFRLVHTIKGTCGFLGLPRLEALAHASETLMGKFRDGAPVTVDAVSLILQSLDRIKEILGELEENEAEPDGSDDDLIHELDRLSGVGVGFEGGDETTAASEESTPKEEASEDGGELQVLERELKPGEVSLDELERAFQEADGPEDMEMPAAPEPEAKAEEPKPEEPKAEEPKADAPQEVKKEAKAEATAKKEKKDSVVNQTIRVNVDTLESLMTMVSELVLTRNQLMEMVRRLHNSEFKVPLQRLSNVTAELQEGVMKTRMQPIGNAWQKLPRIVRDLGNELDKKIDLVMTGAETELDRQVLELIKDPLTHMVRNSADHGLETTEERIEVGKSEIGKVNLSAYHEGGHIIIEIADDGKGLNADRIKEKALENGLATQDEIDSMSDNAIQKFIFRAGFSTAKEVTAVSGRGVGMDVVRTNIELIGGSVDVKSVPGKGSTFYIKIPLTLAIVSALIVEVSGERFAIPQLSVVELVRARQGTDQRIETINGTPVLRLRNKLLPLIQLSDLLELDAAETVIPEEAETEEGAPEAVSEDAEQPPAEEAEKGEIPAEEKAPETAEAPEAAGELEGELASLVEEAEEAEDGYIIVAQVGSQNFGIVVDSIFDTEEIVVKPMSTMLREVSIFSGNTILGDGSVIMIIDPNGIANMVSHNNNEVSEPDENEEVHETSSSDEVVSVLLFRAGSGEPKAVPLSLVTRLEEIKGSEIEPSNGRNLIQYRGKLMPLVYVEEDGLARDHSEEQPVLVFTDDDRVMGLVVDEIVDIVESPLNIEVPSDKEGTLGSAVIEGEATEVIDIGFYLPQAFEDWFTRQDSDRLNLNKRVLLVDDSSFFRNMFTPVLSSAGYTVVSADSAEQAMSIKEEGQMFDIIISDIEMPETDGFDFAAGLRADKDWGKIPIIALSSHTSKEAFEKAREAGFVDYVAKFDRDGLIESLKEISGPVGEAA